MEYTEERFFKQLGRRVVAKLYGADVYSSEATKLEYLDSIREERVIKKIYPKIEDYVKKNIVVPAYTTGGLLSLIKRNKFSNQITSSMYGMYVPNHNRVYLLLDSDSSRFKTNNLKLALVTIHELMHYSAANNPSVFLKAFLPSLIDFYTSVLMFFSNRKVSKTKIRDLVLFLFTNFESGKHSSLSPRLASLKKFYHETVFESNSPKTTIMVNDIMYVLNLYVKNQALFLKSINSDKRVNRLAFSIFDSYKRVYGLNKIETTPVQEMLYISEVAAVTSFKLSNEHYMVL